MPYIGNKPLAKYATLTRQTFSSPTGTSHTLSQTVTNSDDLLLYINNVKQNPADYTASGTTLTTASLAGGTEMYCLYYGKTTETVAPPASSVGDSHIVDMASSKLTGTIADARFPATLPAVSGANLTGLPESGDKRNYFIDGGHTQWPEGTSATAFSDDYQAGGHPLFVHYNITGTGTLTTERSTDVPTVAASGYQSKYSQLIKCTGTDAVPGTSTQVSMRYHMTGTDFAHLHQQEITVSFWAKTSAQNSGHKYFWTLINSGNNRTYSHSFSPTSTWTKFSHTLTLDTSGTWLLTEADVGMKFQINLAIGPEYDDATEDTWTGSFELHDGSISNFTDHTSNEFYFTQIQIVKGSSSPDFTSPSIATVKKQIAYYIQNEAEADITWKWAGIGGVTSTSTISIKIAYSGGAMRAIPTITSSAAGTWYASDHNTGGAATAISFSGTAKDRTLINITYGATGWGIGNIGYFMRNDSTTTYLYFDARH